MPVFVSFLGTCLALLALLRSGWAARVAMDLPNARSLHTSPTPRIGGLAMLPSVFAAWLLAPHADSLLVGLTFTLLALSFVDDRRGLPVGPRLVVHLVVAVVFVVMRTNVANVWLIALFAFAVVWLINLYNFMDGADGLAGGMAFFGFGAYGFAALTGSDWELAVECWCISAAAAGFLVFNFPPARVFMGDAGAIPFGFLAGALGLEGWSRGLWHYWFPVLVFSPFAVDATVTLLKRMARGERFWLAHKDHYYQRVIRMGATHRQLATMEYGLMGTLGVTAVLGNGHPASDQPVAVQASVVAVWTIVMAILMIAVDLRWKQFAVRCE